MKQLNQLVLKRLRLELFRLPISIHQVRLLFQAQLPVLKKQ